MILQFSIAALLLLLIFGIAMVIPFICGKSLKNIDKERRNQLNHDLYDVRLKEVDVDADQGVVVDKDNIITELQHNLLDDIHADEESKVNNKKWIWIPGVVFLVLASIGLYWSVGAFQKVNNWQASLDRYPAIYKQLFESPDARPTEKELQDLMLGLRSQLADNPDDAQGWLLYSRLGRVFKDQELALTAIKKALQAAPGNIEIELEFIELKMKVGDEYSQAAAQGMLEDILQQDPSNYDAWSMYAFMALQQQDFTAAVYRWQKMLTLVDPKSEQAAMLKSSIAYAQKQFSEQQPATEIVAAVAPPKVPSTTLQEGAYHVNVSIAAAVTYPENSTLFVYAQAVSGSAMPIVALKLPIKTFPIDVVLSDANAMMEGAKLSAYDQFIIKARISADGSVNKAGGQWSGKSGVIKAGQSDIINIIIDQ